MNRGHGLLVFFGATVVALILIVAVAGAPVAGEPRYDTMHSSVAWSPSGTRTMVLAPGPTGQVTTLSVFQPSVFRGPDGSYRMEYTGYVNGLDVVLGAHSSDGITWTKDPSYLFGWNGMSSPFVMAVPGGYRMWVNAILWGGGPLGYLDRIWAWNSSDGITWASAPWLVLDVGNGSAWDGGSVSDPMVVPVPGGGYRMYYTETAANGSSAIGVAFSTDLVRFTKSSANPVLPPSAAGSWDDFSVSSPSVVSGSPWVMFYTGRQQSTHGQIGFATSEDGQQWAPDAVPFLPFDGPGAWDSGGIGGPEFLGGTPQRLYFDGYANETGTSSIGFVNVSSPGTASGAILGVPVLLFVALVAVVGATAALLTVLVYRRWARRKA